MSAKSWLKEYYPTRAREVPEEDAVAHSLQKWIGLRKSNLARHKLNKPPIEVNGGTCALCEHFINIAKPDCPGCPLYEVRGGVRCDTTRSNETDSPFARYYKFTDPRPMIVWLKRIDQTPHVDARLIELLSRCQQAGLELNCEMYKKHGIDVWPCVRITCPSGAWVSFDMKTGKFAGRTDQGRRFSSNVFGGPRKALPLWYRRLCVFFSGLPT